MKYRDPYHSPEKRRSLLPLRMERRVITEIPLVLVNALWLTGKQMELQEFEVIMGKKKPP
ncbi:hypothetical protein J4856_09920 [Prevotella scopos JCM 17725]|uniref:hypothetical protein n=1 Tax=Prevotella scopos TaxID=589437 RepID=UPI00046F3B6E|nr:hypothetical protein [Prevotella scopos]ANR72708.1 hypothetical protein AXF22_04415 [Prevotella scopos JCM 17725]QUB45073.1 hypothetical protein J4856_09920 [Prevotella scopos JCM 17725]